MNSKSIAFIFVLLSLYLVTGLPTNSKLNKRSCSKTHKIRSGDTCYDIWVKYGLSESQFRSLNSGIDCSRLQVDDKVCVKGTSSPSSCKSSYTVQRGDTCYKIAKKYGISESDLYSLNSGLSCSNLKRGQSICVKGHSSSSKKTTKKTSTKKRTTSTKKGSSATSFTWYRECKSSHTYALTFDDGVYDYDDALLDLLKKKGVKATFFINGNNMSDIKSSKVRKVIKRMYNEGHNVLSHTWSHADLTTLSTSHFRSELKQLEDEVYNIIGKRPKAIRPPYMAGADNQNVVNNLKHFGYPYGILWYVDTEDWSNKGNVDTVLNFIKEGLKTSNKPIILNHSVYVGVTKDKLLRLVEKEIDYLKSKGLKGVNMETCIGHSVYRSSGEGFPN